MLRFNPLTLWVTWKKEILGLCSRMERNQIGRIMIILCQYPTYWSQTVLQMLDSRWSLVILWKWISLLLQPESRCSLTWCPRIVCMLEGQSLVCVFGYSLSCFAWLVSLLTPKWDHSSIAHNWLGKHHSWLWVVEKVRVKDVWVPPCQQQ